MRIPTVSLVFLAGIVAQAEAAGVKLTAIRFPVQLTDTTGPKSPPGQAPLSQRVVFEFDGPPKIGAGIAEGLRIRVGGINGEGQTPNEQALGTYQVKGDRVIFTPRLPISALPDDFSPTTSIESDSTLPGLRPGTVYEITVAVGSSNAVKNLTGVKSGVSFPVSFKTTEGIHGDFASQSFYYNAPSSAPKLKSGKTKPKSGTKKIHPNLFSDPAGLFKSIPAGKRPPFTLVFKGPLDPSLTNISPENFRLRAVMAPDGTAVDRVLGIHPALVTNSIKKSKVLIYPEGILPLGYRLNLEVSDQLRSLSGAAQLPQPGSVSFTSVAEYKIASDPQQGSPMGDHLYEDFDTTDRQDTTVVGAGGQFLQLASWDAADSNNLRASFGFSGDGSLGVFEAPDEEIEIILDTDFQLLPLFSGATPDVAAGTIVKGGVFNFTEFRLPPNATLVGRGSNPLVITVTGDACIEGTIDLNGQDGTDDDTFDSAITSAPGGSAGAGGGRGGDGHPVFVPAGAASLKFIQTPHFGQTGFAPGNQVPGGGGGGQCGATMRWAPFTTTACTQQGLGDGSRGAGGGGGSFNVFLPQAPEATGVPVSGRRGAVGIGDHVPEEFSASDPIPGVAGTATEDLAYCAGEGPDTQNAVARKNTNATFAEAYNMGLIYDNGDLMDVSTTWAQTKHVLSGGAAGPAVFSDMDPDNNFIGLGGELAAIQGGQGGGGAGSRTEGLSQICKGVIFDQLNLPFTVLDSKGGGGGGAGGALLMQVLGKLTIEGDSALIMARGGMGGGGEQTGNSQRGGAAGGGSGGCVILQSATKVIMNDANLGATVIDVSSGCGRDASTISGGVTSGVPNGEAFTLQVADGGPGGPGIVQIHSPDVTEIDVTRVNARVALSTFDIRCNTGMSDFNPLVDMAKTPTPLTPRSSARSSWYDLGAVTSDFRPPIVTSAGALQGPIFGIPGVGPFFRGTDPNTGLVSTDSDGFLIDPVDADLDVDAPDLLKSDFIPNGPEHFQSVEVRFEGADEDLANLGSPDLSTSTGFVTDITLVNGKRFIRWQIDFDIASAQGGKAPGPSTPRPQVNFLRVPFKY